MRMPFSRAGYGSEEQNALEEDDVRTLCNKARDVFLDQPCLLHLATPLKVCGEQQ